MKPLLIFFDGPCVFCHFWVRQLCRWDKHDQLRFTTLDHPLVDTIATAHNMDLRTIDSVIVWDQNDTIAIEAQSTFMILNRLGGLWKLLTVFKLLPKTLTNGIYRFVAKNRYPWFGKFDHCPLPEKKYQHKFI
ncbi:MAG: thiol-disulfide oxidoreductase DCC family protein [Flavobacteriaceae bacterium]